MTSCLRPRPLLKNLTFTIVCHPEHLLHCVSAYEGDLIREFGPEIRLGWANRRERRDYSGTEATRRLHNKGSNRSRGRGRRWRNLRVLRALKPFHGLCRSVLHYSLPPSLLLSLSLSYPPSLFLFHLPSALFIGCLKHGFLSVRSIARDRTLPFHRLHLERHIRSVFLHGNENTLPSAVEELVDIESAGALSFLIFYFIYHMWLSCHDMLRFEESRPAL